MGKSRSKLRFELRRTSDRVFENLVGAVFGELKYGTVNTKKLGRLDRMGIDAYALSEDESSFDTVIQCKGFEVPEYGLEQHRQCRDEIAKYAAKGPPAGEYWLSINRPIMDRTLRSELERDLAAILNLS